MQVLIERARPIRIHDLPPGEDLVLSSASERSSNYLIERVVGRSVRLPSAGSITLVDCSDLLLFPCAVFSQVALVRCQRVTVAPPRGAAFACLAEFSAGLSLPSPALLRLLCCMDVRCAGSPVRCDPWTDFVFQDSLEPSCRRPASSVLVDF